MQLKYRSFHVEERTRTTVNHTDMKRERANHAKLFFIVYNMQIGDGLVDAVVMAAYAPYWAHVSSR